MNGLKVGGDGDRRVTVTGLARELGVSPAWLVNLCLEEKVPGVTNTTSVLSLDWCRWVRDRAIRHPEIATQQQLARLSSSQWSGGGAARTGGECVQEQTGREVPSMAAKATHLIEGGHFECAVILLFAAMKSAMERCRPEGAVVNVGLIESTFGSNDDDSLRNDVHRIRIMANRAKYEGVSPSRYDAEHALWIYGWLFGPHGKFGQMSRKSA